MSSRAIHDKMCKMLTPVFPLQTVTYYAWFVANWFTFLLIFLLIVLVLSLCISMTMYSKRTSRRERVYRSQSRHMSSDSPPSYHETTRAVGAQVSVTFLSKLFSVIPLYVYLPTNYSAHILMNVLSRRCYTDY